VAGTRVIAADSGMRHAEALGVLPELWVGDFDSSDPSLLSKHAAVPREQHSTDKDSTDGDIAITKALMQGADSVILVGGIEGSFDHVMCLTMMLVALHRRDITCCMTNGIDDVFPLHNGALNHPKGTRLSIIPISNLKGLTITGVRWPLKNASVAFGSSLTMSNVIEQPGQVTIVSGEGIMIFSPAEK
jgi:thiamine pyrophosphokinase